MPLHLISSHQNQLEDSIATLIKECTNMRTLRRIHAHILKHLSSSPSLPFALSKILGFCALSPAGDIAYARRLFPLIPSPNTFVWNSMIRGTASHSPIPSREPISIYHQMLLSGSSPTPNTFTLAFVLKACSAVPAFLEGQQVHCHAYRYGLGSSPFVQTGLLNFYAKCEDLPAAGSLFDEMPERNLVAWSAMISGYARVGMVNEALGAFRGMQEAGVLPDEVTMVSVISACAKAGALDLGKWVHAFVERKGIRVDLELSTALIDMYAKCGLIERAWRVFDEMEERDTKGWSSMIVGLAIHGHVKDALGLFSRMLESKVYGHGASIKMRLNDTFH